MVEETTMVGVSVSPLVIVTALEGFAVQRIVRLPSSSSVSVAVAPSSSISCPLVTVGRSGPALTVGGC